MHTSGHDPRTPRPHAAAGSRVPCGAADAFDALRLRWRRALIGSGFDPAAEPYASRLAALGATAAGFRGTMAPAGESLWPDQPLASSDSVTGGYARLRVMALAYAQAGTGLTGDASLRDDVVAGLDHLHGHAYHASTTFYGNWWDWNIGAPLALTDTMTLVHDALSSTQLGSWLAAIDHFVPSADQLLHVGPATGANRVDVCAVLARRGMLGRSAAKLAAARDGLSPVLVQVRAGDGFYADGSFIQHRRVPYTGTYGEVLLSGLAAMLAWLAESPWAVTSSHRRVLFDAVATTYAPFIHNGLVMDAVSGRAIARNQSDHQRGHAVSAGILQLAASAPPAEAAVWKAMVKGWTQRERWANITVDPKLGIPALAAVLAVRDDPAVTPSPEPVGHRLFASMDRAVHRRPGWAAVLSLCSGRTAFYETTNGENLKGWHTSNGAYHYWGDTWGGGQYSDSYWPTVDPYRLPGITASRKTLADAWGGAFGLPRPDTVWAGGACDGAHAALGQDTRGPDSSLKAKKSWFFVGDTITCLGAGITATDGTAVETTIDNRGLGGGPLTGSLTVDGVGRPAATGWSATFPDAGWAQLDGAAGYIFPGGADVRVLSESRTGSWSQISASGSTAPISRDYLTLWLDHGVDPAGASYHYLLLPGADAGTTAARAANPTVTALSNTTTAQAITDSATGVTAANFFTAGTAGPVTVSAPCSVLIHEHGGQLKVTVADPTRAATTVTVTLARSGYATAACDPQVSITNVDPITLVVEVGGSLGAGRSLTLGTGSAVTGGQHLTLAPVADAYVRDGSYATTNFGNDQYMIIKNASAGWARRAYLKFDLTALTGAPRRAVLWVSGHTADSAGTHTTISAYTTGSGWTENDITWNTSPALGTVEATAPLCDVTDWIPLDVTSLITSAYISGATAAVAIYQSSAGLATVINSRRNPVRPPFLQVISD
ncbi:hypothetical protein GCM10009661_81810 [Catellatospora chokoriensis]|uniref:Hyaluronate lyase n=1 Tax=Catellatospora chokoriensis TaxID=310353 RepID=A0A8J3K7R2_9ACTN|nr:hypothetical protein Cch02nite_75770 [Catellatospora chokoriensis]